MSNRSLKNIATSVRQRLLNKAKTDDRPFQEIVQFYALERFLYRLSQSPHADRFILKGALLLRAWHSPQFRSTMDIDMLGRTNNEEADIVSQFLEIMSVEVDPDGLSFLPESITSDRITEDAEYKGVRIQFLATLDTMRLNMQVDIGFGDVVFPGPEESNLPTMLDFPSPRLLCYSKESVIAEKFEAMVKLRDLNSRMKDFYDIWLLSSQFDFEGKILAEAINRTLLNRGTDLPSEITAFSKTFIENKQVQWKAFYKKLKQGHVPTEFGEVASAVKDFLTPIALALYSGTAVPDKWFAPGPWT